MAGQWGIHWLEAEGSLLEWRARIGAEIEAVCKLLEQHGFAINLDILVHKQADNVIPELGMGGYAHRSSLFSLSVDPANPKFASALQDGAVKRLVLHETHHCLRMTGPGYGQTLGDALVTEGLAGQFVHCFLGTSPELWECAFGQKELSRRFPNTTELASLNYDHASWFFGTGDHPRWLGYTLGYEIVGRWLKEVGPVDAQTWANVSTQTVLETAERQTQSVLQG